jgi:serine/threonine protein kinase
VRKVRTQPLSPAETVLRAGQLIDGKYRVEHLLGQGGMAAVWAGTNERTGKRFALKAIRQSLVSAPEAQQLLHSEALAASRVNHPNVVTVFDVIKHERMTCIVMELLEGETLDSYLARNGFIRAEEVSTLLLPAMRGVAAAHAQGVIHRDLKPQNIFICIESDGRVVTTKVLDFGISVMVEQVMDSGTGSVPGLMLGTPTYMSPEHISGVIRLDGRADVYGFGVLLYEALTGQVPFPGEPGPALFQQIANQPAPSVTLFRPDLPTGLVHIIETAMSKERDQRYSSMNSMVSALERELPPPKALAGVPAAFRHQPLATHSQPGAEAVPRTEGSAQETKFLFGVSLQPERLESTPTGALGDAFDNVWGEESGNAETDNEALNDGLDETALLPDLDPTPVVLRLRRAPRGETFGFAWLSRLRGWRGAVAAGAAAVLVLVAWLAVRGGRPVQAAALSPVAKPAPLASEIATPQPIPVRIANVHPVADLSAIRASAKSATPDADGLSVEDFLEGLYVPPRPSQGIQRCEKQFGAGGPAGLCVAKTPTRANWGYRNGKEGSSHASTCTIFGHGDLGCSGLQQQWQQRPRRKQRRSRRERRRR